MKRLLILIFLFPCLFAHAQNQPVNSSIKEITIYGRNATTVLGKLIVNKAVTTKLFLLKSIQKKDSLNNYITTFYLGNKETTSMASIKIIMKFNKPVIDVSPDNFLSAFNTVKGFSEDRLQYIFKAAPLNRDTGSAIVISFTIKSKERITTEISGLDGVL